MDPSKGRVRVKFKFRTNRSVKLGPLSQTFQPAGYLESVPVNSAQSDPVRPSSPCGSSVSFVSCHDDLNSVPSNATASLIPAVKCSSVPPGFQPRSVPVGTPPNSSSTSDPANSNSDPTNDMNLPDLSTVSPSPVAAHTRQKKKLANITGAKKSAVKAKKANGPASSALPPVPLPEPFLSMPVLPTNDSTSPLNETLLFSDPCDLNDDSGHSLSCDILAADSQFPTEVADVPLDLSPARNSSSSSPSGACDLKIPETPPPGVTSSSSGESFVPDYHMTQDFGG